MVPFWYLESDWMSNFDWSGLFRESQRISTKSRTSSISISFIPVWSLAIFLVSKLRSRFQVFPLIKLFCSTYMCILLWTFLSILLKENSIEYLIKIMQIFYLKILLTSFIVLIWDWFLLILELTLSWDAPSS